MNTNWPGSKWWKFDFHNHTPASLDYKGDKLITPEQWLQNYLDSGVQCIVVTDHNTGAWIDKLKNSLDILKQQDALKWGSLTIFPGVEISCNQGVHLKAILDPSKSTADIEAIRGSVGYTGTPGDSNGVTRESVEQVIRAIHLAGGIACAAHVDQPKGLLVSVTDHNTLQPILKLIDALEVIDLAAPCLQSHTSLSEKAFVLGSDSHQPKDIGRGFTWVKMSAPSIEGLKLALLDPHSSIIRSDENKTNPNITPDLRVESLKLTQLYLRRQSPLEIHFSPWFSSVIGGRGSGKSTLLETLRLALARDNEINELVDSDVKRAFDRFTNISSGRGGQGMMRTETVISAIVKKENSGALETYQYQWTPSKHNVLRKNDSGEWEETNLDTNQARLNFPVKIFSQKQIFEMAESPRALLSYIDDALSGDLSNWDIENKEIKKQLRELRQKERQLVNELKKKPLLELENKEISRKLFVFNKSNLAAKVNSYNENRQSKTALEEFIHKASDQVASLESILHTDVSLSPLVFPQPLTKQVEIKGVVESAGSLTTKINENYLKIKNLIIAMKGDIDSFKNDTFVKEYSESLDKLMNEYRAEVSKLRAEGLGSTEEAEAALIRQKEVELSLLVLSQHENDLKITRSRIVKKYILLKRHRQLKTKLRQKFVDEILENNIFLKITINPFDDIETSTEDFRRILRLQDGTFVDDVTEILNAVTAPEKISPVHRRISDLKIDLFSRERSVLDVTIHGKLLSAIQKLNDEDDDSLLEWFPEDKVKVEYRRESSGSLHSLESASAGQKTSAILSFILHHGNEPLILDQPEDDLDNALVSDLVVSQLRSNKQRRQIIVITHNANIVVNGDSELVLPMEFINGQITNNIAGGLQEREVRRKICAIMEGGEKAFEQRYKRILEDMRETL